MGSVAVAPVAAGVPARAPMKFVFSRPLDNPRTQWLIRVYTDVVSSVGRQFVYVDVPPKRATLLVLNGEVDGELGRTFDYAALYPALLRVPEPNNVVKFGCYRLSHSPEGFDWETVRQRHWRCEYRRGIAEIERLLQANIRQNPVSAVSNVEQGLHKLLLGRADLYFDVEEAVEDACTLEHTALAQALQRSSIHKYQTVAQTTGHAYLNARHHAYIPQFADRLQQMKKSGLVAQYLQQALAAYDRRGVGAMQMGPTPIMKNAELQGRIGVL